MSAQSEQSYQLTGIDPQLLYPESELRRLVELQTIRKAKRAGLSSYRFGRQSWILGADLIEHVQQQSKPFVRSTNDCELCSNYPQEHFVESGKWAGKHVCTQCWESLPQNQED